MSDDARITDRTEHNAATSFRDNFAGPPVEQRAVTGRAVDVPEENTTFATRAKAAKATTRTKAVEDDATENKAVKRSTTKAKGK